MSLIDVVVRLEYNKLYSMIKCSFASSIFQINPFWLMGSLAVLRIDIIDVMCTFWCACVSVLEVMCHCGWTKSRRRWWARRGCKMQLCYLESVSMSGWKMIPPRTFTRNHQLLTTHSHVSPPSDWTFAHTPINHPSHLRMTPTSLTVTCQSRHSFTHLSARSFYIRKAGKVPRGRRAIKFPIGYLHPSPLCGIQYCFSCTKTNKQKKQLSELEMSGFR